MEPSDTREELTEPATHEDAPEVTADEALDILPTPDELETELDEARN